MTLLQILIFLLLAFIIGITPKTALRRWCMFFLSLLAVYVLQPSTPIRYLNFWLPTASVCLAVWGWAVTLPSDKPLRQVNRKDGITFALILAFVLSLGILDYDVFGLTLSLPPINGMLITLGVILIGGIILWGIGLSMRLSVGILFLYIIFLILLFILLKTDAFSTLISAWLRYFNNQDPALASHLDIRWLGFSYLCFRIIHTLRERMNGKLAYTSLQEYFTYLLFFPAITAGPIDRIERFGKDWQQSQTLQLGVHTQKQSVNTLYEAGQLVLLGLFKKFVLADSLALLSLNQQNVKDVTMSSWLWVLVYLYAFQIYFDFSGYTDIAIGMGKMMGINLPQNFNRPYLQSSLTTFWNNWHITLTQWFRAYYFNPLARNLRKLSWLPSWVSIIFCQVSTMILIGLWHGVSVHFIIWGLWHGVGLFIHNRWTAWTRPLSFSTEAHPHLLRFSNAFGTLLTFNYVALGWVWFCLPNAALAWQTLQKMFMWG